MIRFREKIYSFQDIVNNLQTGALAAGTISSIILNNKDVIKNPILKKALLGTSIGIAVISGLGLLADYYDKKKSINETGRNINYNLRNVTDILRYDGFNEGSDFFINPKEADLQKVLVSIVIRKDVGSMDVIVRGSSDKKTENNRIKRIISNLPDNNARFFNKDKDKTGNELIITSLNTSFDPEYISDIAKKFIGEGFPVYLLEINR
jgi:hypothetical protein